MSEREPEQKPVKKRGAGTRKKEMSDVREEERGKSALKIILELDVDQLMRNVAGKVGEAIDRRRKKPKPGSV